MLLPYEKFLVDKLDHNRTPVESPDLTDIANTDTFEELAPHSCFFAITTLGQPTINKSLDMPDAPEQLPNGMGVGNTEGMPTVVINHFPSASAGVPINNMRCRNSMYELQQSTDRDTIWSLFTSQSDWLFAHWAKMYGSISSAVAELLAIPEV